MEPEREGRQRIGPLTRIPGLLKDMGADPADVLGDSAGLPADALNDSDGSITYLAASRLLEACVALTGCLHFGLLVGQLAKLDDFGTVGQLMRTAPDLRTALFDWVGHQHCQCRGAVTCLLALDDTLLFGYAVYQPGVAALDQIADLVMAANCSVLRELADARPDEILLAHSPPGDLRPYRRIFPSPVRFDAEQTGLLLSLSSLARPNRGANPAMHSELERQIARSASGEEPDFKTRLLRLLRPQIVVHSPRVEEVADHLSVHPRTLNRRLHDEGTSFREVLNEARFEVARQLLSNTQMEITQIALAFGYANSSVFSHAFRRWAGVPPSEWRTKR
jgi:AraC-like DNA-binding protein